MSAKPWSTLRRNQFVLGLGLIAVLVALSLIPSVRERFTGPPLASSLQAYLQGHWETTITMAERHLARSPGDPAALRLKARGLAQLGRHREAVDIDILLGSASLEAEDLFVLGQGLIQEGRLALGSASLEAASKLDPKHPGTVAALAELQQKLKANPKAMGQADRLSALPTGAALGELVLGYAAIVSDSQATDAPDAIVDRSLRTPRSVFLKLNSPAAARKFIARLMLEEGRAAQARDLLDRIDDRSKDPEANWLLSRAYLAMGSIDKASDCLEKAGHWGKEHPLSPEPGLYVGAKACAECHGTIYKSQQNSHHAATMTWGKGLESLAIPTGPVKDSEDPRVIHQWVRTNDGIRASAEVDGNAYQGIVDYVLGSGHHGLSMLAKEKAGGHRSLRLSYYPPGDSWSMTGGFNPHPTDPHIFLGEPVSDDGLRTCLNCHSTRFISEKDRKGPEVADRGIGCERCHGPGENHVKSVASGFGQLAIARPKLATPSQRMALCAQCHLANGAIAPSDPKFIRFQSTTLAYSRCYTESSDRLDCVSCHDPHRNAETSPAYYEARCLTCHDANTSAKPRSPEIRIEPMSATVCPVNATKDCLNCHMPKLENVMPFSKFTDHHIRVRRQESKPNEPASTR